MVTTSSPPTRERHASLVLAVELGAEARPRALKLDLESAAGLSDHVARDLARLAPGVQAAGVAIGAALYDQAQLLRPRFPIFEDLTRLYLDEAPDREDVPHIVAFGASAQRMASATLEPDARLVGGPLLFVPIVLVEHDTPLAPLVTYLDETLEESGLADAATALYLTEAFSVPVEHARYLTRTDLCALCAVQLEHANLGAAWELLEAALFGVGDRETVATLAGQSISIERGVVTLPATTFVAADGVERFVDRMRELRQYAALLGAHEVPFETSHGGADDGWIDVIDADVDGAAPRALYAHHVRDLGTVALTVAAHEADGARVIANGYAATRAGLDSVRHRLATTYGVDAPVRSLDGVVVDAESGALSVP